GPLLLVPNHASYLDPLALAAALPLRRQPGVHWAGWAGLLFASGSMRLVSHACNVFALDPRRGGLAGIAVAEALLRQGRSVVWFPEGRRSPDGRLQPFTPGIGLLIARTGATAIPVRIRGSFQAWPRSRRLPRPHPIGVVFGRPLAGCELVASGAGDESHRKITERLREAVEALE
ncbi:MAG: lysophospholipid acyltransferase family protein, partial [Tistlia sp.]